MSEPWIPYLARFFLDGYLKQGMDVFEYGSGGSTIYFEQKGCNIVSIEHDRQWYETMAQLSWSVLFYPPESAEIGPDKSNPAHYRSGCIGGNFKDYVTTIDQYGTFDLVFVDGRARASCLAHAYAHVKPGGLLMLDNAERDYYLTQTAHLFDGWDVATFEGHGPRLDWPWKCVCWRKP